MSRLSWIEGFSRFSSRIEFLLPFRFARFAYKCASGLVKGPPLLQVHHHYCTGRNGIAKLDLKSLISPCAMVDGTSQNDDASEKSISDFFITTQLRMQNYFYGIFKFFINSGILTLNLNSPYKKKSTFSI